MKINLPCAIFLLTISFYVNAGRMPSELERVESAGSGYLKLYPAAPELEGEFHVVQTCDVKRIVGGTKKDVCYVYYSSGVELVKLPVKTQNCDSVLQELQKSNR